MGRESGRIIISERGKSLGSITEGQTLVFAGEEEEKVIGVDNSNGTLWTEGPDGEGGLGCYEYRFALTRKVYPDSEASRVFSLYNGYPFSLMMFKRAHTRQSGGRVA